jgi:hypothetical protein
MKVYDSDVNDMKREEHILIRALDKKEITELEFTEKVVPLRQKILDKVKSLIENINNNQSKEVVDTMAEKTKQETKEKKVGVKSRANSVASAIAETLMRKGVRNMDQAMEEVKRLKPEVATKGLKNKISVIIRETKDGKGRWKNYTWDEANFLLTPKA